MTTSRHDQLGIQRLLTRRAVWVVVALGPVSTACDPETGAWTVEGDLRVETETSCSVEGDCAAVDFVVTGDGYTPDTSLKVYIPDGQIDGLPEIVFASSAHVGGSGSFSPIEQRIPCVAVPRPADAPSVLSLVADDASSGARRGFTFVDSAEVICQPPFTQLLYTLPCGVDLCPDLRVEGESTIWVSWNSRDLDYDRYRIRYAPMDTGAWTEIDKDYGDDVSAVPVRNLETGTTYEFELLPCYTRFLAPSECAGWQRIGLGAAG